MLGVKACVSCMLARVWQGPLWKVRCQEDKLQSGQKLNKQ